MGASSLTTVPVRNPAPTQSISFVKMQGAGNDFVVVDGRERLPFDPEEFAQAACDRHFGVGADGIILLAPSTVCDFAMVYHNADGSRAICLNGMRCISRFIYSKGLLQPDQKKFQLETDRGPVAIELFGRGERVRVDIGEPIFDGSRIPTAETGEQLGVSLRVGESLVTIHAVGMGNPHCVIIVNDVEQAPVLTLGPEIEGHSFFPERTNVEFVQILDRGHVRLRVWERGVGETLACGTGVCAVVAALARIGRTDRRMSVECTGGEFEVIWSESTNRLSLTGPAEEVYRGNIDAGDLIRSWKVRKA